MSALLDKKYISFMSTRLTRFHWIRETVAVCKCPICGDGSKGRGTRFHFYEDLRFGSGQYYYDCKNCGAAGIFSNFLKDQDPALYSEYKLEKFIEKHGRAPIPKTKSIPSISIPSVQQAAVVPYAIPISKLPDAHPCKQYVNSRLIPTEFHDKLFYTVNFRKLVSLYINVEYAKRIPEDGRLVIPFFDQYGNVQIIQGRSLEENPTIRYVTVKKNDDVDKVFGLDRVDRSKEVIVVEGPLDSLFLPNALAAADANLLKVKGDTYIPDFQYRNPDICRHINHMIEAGVKVVIMPKDFPFKDVNDMILNGMTREEVMVAINNNTYQGLKAKLKFSQI